VSRSKSDTFDAFVLADYVRTHYQTLTPLTPNSDQMAELKMLVRDYDQQMRHKRRMTSQLRSDLKAFYPRIVEAFNDLTSPVCRDFLKRFPTPSDLDKLTRRRFESLCKRHRLWTKTIDELWQKLDKPQLPVPEHVMRAKMLSVLTLLQELEVVLSAVERYRKTIEDFFDNLPVAQIAKSLPGGQSGVMIPSLWAELGDAEGRWESFRHLQAYGGSVPITDQSGKRKAVSYRFACNKRLRYHSTWLAQCSLNESEWARDYYDAQKARGKSHRQAQRALAAKWIKIIFVMWRDCLPYDENRHLANLYKQNKNQHVLA
jgi:transposase